MLLKNATIITMDESNPVIYNGYIATRNKRIVLVSDRLGEEETCYGQVIDAKGKIVMPGLCNAHSHVAMTLLRGYAEGYSLQDWLFTKIFPVEDRLDGDDIYWGTMLGIAEMIRTGTTLVNDCYYFMDRAIAAYAETGFNANISRGLMNDQLKEDYSDDYRLNEMIELFEKFNGKYDDLIRVECFPHAIYTCSPEYFRYIAKLTEKYGIPVTTHISENETENRECIEKYGMTPTQVYRQAGLFDNPVNIAHGVWLSDEDLEVVRDSNSTVTHNPSSNLKLGSGIANILKYKNMGINIALGTDGCSSNNNLNMFEEMHLAALLLSGTNDPSLVKPWDVLKFATVNGAKAMARSTKGVLKEGYDADFIMIDNTEPYYYPHHSPVNNILYSAQGPDVCLTVINGRVVYRDGEYKSLDIERVKAETMRVKDKIFH